MAFEQNATKNKNQFAARIVSEKTGRTIGWFHPVDEFARNVCGVNNVTEMSYSQAVDTLTPLIAGIAITDLTAEREMIAATDY